MKAKLSKAFCFFFSKKKTSSFFEKKEAKKLLSIFGLWLAMSGAAYGETRSVDASIWAITGDNILVRVIEPDSVWRQLPSDNGGPITIDDLGQYILGHYGARSAGGDCAAVDLGFDLGKVTPMTYIPGERRYEMILHCPSADNITLINRAVFAEIPGHTNQALISRNNAPGVRQVFSTDREEIPATAPPISAASQIGVGWHHFWFDIDNVLFVLGFFALCGLGRRLRYAFAGLVAGRVVCLLAVASNRIEPVVAHGEWLAGFLLLLIAAELIGKRTSRAPLAFAALMALLAALAWKIGGPVALPLAGGLLGAGYLRLRRLLPAMEYLWVVPAALFGMADGLDYWPDLALLGRPATGTLALFNLGALVGAAVLWLVCGGVNKIRFAPRAEWAAIALAGFGGFMVLSRL